MEDQDAHRRAAYRRLPRSALPPAAPLESRREHQPALSPAQPRQRARDPARGRARRDLPRPRHRASRWRSSARCCRSRPRASRLPWAVENLRFCPWCDQLAQKDLNDCPTCGRRMGPLGRVSGEPAAALRAARRARRARRCCCSAASALGACGGEQRLGRGAQEHARHHAAERHQRRKGSRADDLDLDDRDDESHSHHRRKHHRARTGGSEAERRRILRSRRQRSARSEANPPAAPPAAHRPKKHADGDRTGARRLEARRGGAERAAPAAPARAGRRRPLSARSGRGDQRRAVGQARGLVQAEVLHGRADLRLGASGAGARALLLRPAGPPGGVVAEAERQRRRPRGTVSATMSPFLTGIVVSSGNWAVLPKYGFELDRAGSGRSACR